MHFNINRRDLSPFLEGWRVFLAVLIKLHFLQKEVSCCTTFCWHFHIYCSSVCETANSKICCKRKDTNRKWPQSLTLQNIPAFCLSFPSGPAVNSACSQAHPYKHPPFSHTHPHSVSNPADTSLGEDLLSQCALTPFTCPAGEIKKRGWIRRLPGWKNPNNWWWSLSGWRWKHPISMSVHSAHNGWPTWWKMLHSA